MKLKAENMRLIALIVGMLLTLQAYTQDAAPAAPAAEGGSSDDIVSSSLQDFSIVMGVGIGGAILGLSTLSFVDEPKEHLNNVVTGGAIGIIIGVGIVAYNQATKSQESYLEGAAYEGFSTKERLAWHHHSSVGNLPKKEMPLLLKTFSF